MQTYDWIVVGGGITGASLGYELAKQGFKVLLLEQHHRLQGATRYSYGGIAYWAGTTDLMRQLCQEGIDRHRQLSAELEADTQYRELNLLLTIAADQDPDRIAATYTEYAAPPQRLSISEACELEPLLNPAAIAGALTIRHGHLDAEAATEAYCQAFTRLGGTIQIAQVLELISRGDRIQGVKTTTGIYHAANVVVCAGGMSRALLQAANIPVRLYFSHAELLETPPIDLQLRTLVMPAALQRFQLEAEASHPDGVWNQPGHEPTPAVLDVGAVQFQDGSLRIGQISRALTDPDANLNPQAGEALLRSGIGQVLPALQNLATQWHSCLVAFSGDSLPLIGALPNLTGAYIFSGFSNPLAILPPLAYRFARHLAGEPDEIIQQLSPTRFAESPSSNSLKS